MQDCRHKTWPITKEMLFNVNATWGPYHTVYGHFMINPVFQIAVQAAWSYTNVSTKRESGNLITGRASWDKSGGAYVESNCSLVPAILEYDVEFQKGQVTLKSPEEAKVVALANNTIRAPVYNPVELPCTMDSFYSFAEIMVAANASAAFFLPAAPGAYWSLYPGSMDLQVAKHLDLSSGAMSVNFRDPGPSVLGVLNQMLFRGGIMAGSWSNTTKLIDAGELKIFEASSTMRC